MKKCKSKQVKKHHRITMALDEELWERFQPVRKKKWGDSFTSWVEYAMECYSRDDCTDCPYAEEEGQERVSLCKIYTDEDNQKTNNPLP